MIRAFELGGDFHSRTALGMYDHIQAAVDSGASICTPFWALTYLLPFSLVITLSNYHIACRRGLRCVDLFPFPGTDLRTTLLSWYHNE